MDWTINIGTIVQLAVLLAAGLRAHVSNRERLTRIETRLDALEEAVDRRRR
jgi:hypothetical protein